MNIKNILKYAGRPEVFEEGTSGMWDDPHISKYMLEAHLDPGWDAASRKPETIDRTIAWLNDGFLRPCSRILDLGCGPGLYAERLSGLGHKVTGIDFSRRSVEYARRAAAEKGLDIEYIYRNYLEMDYYEEFDAVILIYCDFGALSNSSRDVLLKKIHKALKPGGCFIFDACTEGLKEDKKAGKDWYCSQEGFWSAKDHIVLSEVFHYPEEKVFLSQYIVLAESEEPKVYRVYDHYYSEGDMTALLNQNGFRNCRFFYDLIQDSGFASNKVVFTYAEK